MHRHKHLKVNRWVAIAFVGALGLFAASLFFQSSNDTDFGYHDAEGDAFEIIDTLD